MLNALFYGLPLERHRELPRAGERHHAGRHPARRAAVSAARPAVGRPRRQRVGVHGRPARRRVPEVRARGAARSRPDVVRASQRRPTAAPGRAAGSRASRRRMPHRHDFVRRGVRRSLRRRARAASCSARDRASTSFGLGGEQLRAAGAELVGDYRGLAVTGLTEALARAAAVVRPCCGSSSRRARDATGPTCSSLIDFPDFNFRLARPLRARSAFRSSTTSARSSGRGGRAACKTMKQRRVEGARHLPVRGGALRARRRAGRVRRPSAGRSDRRSPSRANALLAGAGSTRRRRRSRCCRAAGPTKCARILPILAAAATLIRQRVPAAQFVVARAPKLSDHAVRAVLALRRAVRDRRRPRRRRAERQRRGDHGVGHGDGADGAARQADGHRVSARRR